MSVQVGAGNESLELAVSPATLGSTAQALSLPELLTLVFYFSQLADVATSARVCKGWSDTALNYLWRDLDSVFPLLELLFDINLIKGKPGSFMLKKLINVLGNADWDRFHSYGKRVRSLEFDEAWTYREDPQTPELDPMIVAVLCLHHPFGASFLPRLQKLNWATEGSALSMLPFLSGELKELYLEMSTETASMVNEVLKVIIHRSPSLIKLSLEAKVQVVRVETSLAKWLQTTENLEEVSVPPYYLTPVIIQTLGSLPKLNVIEQGLKFTHPSDSSGVPQFLPPGTFPNLTDISFNATLSEAQKFLLASQEVGSRLVRITLHAFGTMDSEDIPNFARHVAQNCPLMVNLGLDLFKVLESGARPASQLTMALLESLYPCTQLESVGIGHPFPFTFHEDNVEQMGRAWPQMAFLDVCPDPDFSFPIEGQMGNPLSILSAFAKALPKLKFLSLYFNQQEAPPFVDNLWPQHQFQNLTEVYFGLSGIPGDSVRKVGFYIASLCKERPLVGYGASSWHTGNLPSDWARTETAWKEVVETVDFAMGVKLAGQSSSQESVAQ
ncbi:hypothetical protein FRC01_002872 [Tulasnella sp. 417]|nr:hypothetical protein FRC01_002872 [Tulasnella sp. 417]